MTKSVRDCLCPLCILEKALALSLDATAHSAHLSMDAAAAGRGTAARCARALGAFLERVSHTVDIPIEEIFDEIRRERDHCIETRKAIEEKEACGGRTH